MLSKKNNEPSNVSNNRRTLPPQQRVLPARLAPRQHQPQQQLQQRPRQLQQQRL
ncbi:unnamed protein product, partial [Rotaria magnacalcarata]